MSDYTAAGDAEKNDNTAKMQKHMYFLKRMSDYVWGPNPDPNWPDTPTEK